MRDGSENESILDFWDSVNTDSLRRVSWPHSVNLQRTAMTAVLSVAPPGQCHH